MNVLYLTNVPAPYRVLYFNELAKYCDLTVLYQRKNSAERDDQWKLRSDGTFKEIYLKGIRTGAEYALSFEVIRYLKKPFDVVVICGNASPTEIIAIRYCQRKGIPYCIEGDGAFVKQVSALKKYIKTKLISKAERMFSTCGEHDRYYLFYGVAPERIVRYRFTSVKEEDIARDMPGPEEKKKLRDMLGMNEEKIILAVGQFIPRKGFDVLLDAVKGIPDAGVYIIGGEATEEYKQQVMRNGLTCVHFVGFMGKEELMRYYKAGSVFVLPTREDIWGLVINEAMANGLAVVSTNRCNAATELVRDNENGFVVPADSAQALHEAIVSALADEKRMGQRSLEIIRGYTIEEMAKDHMTAFEQLCS